MELQDLIKGIAKFDDLQEKIIASKENTGTSWEDLRKQWDPVEHTVMKRPDKVVKTGKGANTSSKLVPVAKLAIPLQKRIVDLRATFLCGRPIQLAAQAEDGSTEEKYLKVLKKVWTDNKLDYKSKQIAKILFSEKEVAEIWYDEKVDAEYWADTLLAGVTKRPRVRILARSLGDELYPVYDDFDDLVAFGRKYKTKDFDGKEIEHFDLFTAATIYTATREANKSAEWAVNAPVKNPYGKIPIIYYSQDRAEWEDVQTQIDRYEFLKSKWADTNDYHGSPTIMVEGKVVGWSDKGESGNILEIGPGGKASYLAWTQAPESIKLELEFLKSDIFDQTSTPNLTFESVKGLGTFSGFALEMLFMDAHMKASDKEETFGESIQRRINYITAMLGVLSSKAKAVKLDVKPKFEYFLPKNKLEIIQMINQSMGGEKPTLSQKTAIRLNPIVENPEKEQEQLETEQQEQDAKDAKDAKSAKGLDGILKAM